MTPRTLFFVICTLICGPALAMPPAVRPKPVKATPAPMVFYVAKGAPDACGRGCDSWIAVEGQIDSGAAPRFKKFWQRIKNRNLPLYFSSPGGNLVQALAIGETLRETPVVARVARTVVRECGFEAQDSDVCLKLKQSGRELHGDLSTRGAMCNSACPYLILGAPTREIAPDVILAVHSPKVVLNNHAETTPQMRAAVTERGLERADRIVSSYLLKMGVAGGLLDVARSVKFESLHILTREEIILFGIDRREFVETPWTFENAGRSMVRKAAIQKGDKETSYRLAQWRLVCFSANQFELDFLRPSSALSTFSTITIANVGPKPLFFTPLSSKPPGSELYGVRLDRATVQSLVEQPKFDFTESLFGPDGRRIVRPEKLSTEGLTSALASLLTTCPSPQDTTSQLADKPQDSAAK